jgi:hypothetical protein
LILPENASRRRLEDRSLNAKVSFMRELFILIAHLLVSLAKLTRPGGLGAVAAESLAVKHQLLIMKRAQRHAPKLTCVWSTGSICLLNGRRSCRRSESTRAATGPISERRWMSEFGSKREANRLFCAWRQSREIRRIGCETRALRFASSAQGWGTTSRSSTTLYLRSKGGNQKSPLLFDADATA